ncbi:MAG: hypothetical protein HY092_01300 [Candidatus Kerfeldbacteria bacterium]|nr:hypothetical protein [Candidatus Kerfeldbacteria bacterium]
MDAVLRGHHSLRKVVEWADHQSRIDGGFFLVFGGINSSTSENLRVKFAWRMNDGTYAISSLPLEQIRIKIDDRVTVPTIQFAFSHPWDSGYDSDDPQYLMGRYVQYAVVTVRDQDWPVKIQMPLNDKT